MLGLGLKPTSFVAQPHIGDVTITGSSTPSMQTATSYSVSFTGDATDTTYAWSVSPSANVVISDTTAASPNITFPFSNTTHTVSCVVSSATASDSPKTVDLSVTTNTTNVVSYLSDFSADVDGFSVYSNSDSELNANVDAEGKTDLLQWTWTATSADGNAFIRRTMDATISDQANNGTIFAFSCEIYYDDADSSGVDGTIQFNASLGTFSPSQIVNLSGTDQWHDLYFTLSAGATTPNSDFMTIGFSQAGDIPTSGDSIYFKNIRLEYIDAS